jgi:cbb3-type cytochrome oxidase subunit 3
MEFDISLDISNTWVVIWFTILLSSIAMVIWMRRKEPRARLEARIRRFCHKWLG